MCYHLFGISVYFDYWFSIAPFISPTFIELINWLVDWLIACLIHWSMHELSDYLTDRMIDCLLTWLTDWLLDWLIGFSFIVCFYRSIQLLPKLVDAHWHRHLLHLLQGNPKVCKHKSIQILSSLDRKERSQNKSFVFCIMHYLLLLLVLQAFFSSMKREYRCGVSWIIKLLSYSSESVLFLIMQQSISSVAQSSELLPSLFSL